MAGLFDEILRKEQQDTISPTPRNAVLGGLADLLAAASSPERTQQMQGLASFLSIPAVATTLDRLSYGEPLTTGSGGLGGTTRIRPEALEAAMTMAPMAPAAGQLAKRAVMATKGLPVGASIKDVGSKFNVVARDASEIFGDGAARVRYTEPNSGGSIEVLRRPDGSASVLSLEVPEKFRGKKIGESLQAQVMQDFPVLQGQVSSKAAAKTAYRLGRRPPSQPDASLDDVYKIMDENSSVNLVSPQMQRSFMPAFQYPQEEAMRLAQQRAALPVEQGGLGLPVGNTAEQRAKAMGFDVNNPMYHATDVEFESIRPSLTGKLGSGVYVSPSSKYAEKYAGENARVLPLVARGQLASEDVAMDIAESIRQRLAAQNPDFSVPEWKRQTTQAITDAGYSGRSMSGLESVITDPENIRSINAAFDPFRRNAAIAAATGSLAPDLLAAQEDEVLKQRLSGLINSISP